MGYEAVVLGYYIAVPAFLAEAHADAEAQAQVQVPQVQVGEVSDVNSNVNSANSHPLL